ncbi:MAG: trigger factor [bacterium]|nr:trigger factor [bacterium]
MQHIIKKLPKSTLEITVELTPEEMQSYLQKAATHLSQETTIPGFRPGKAPYDQIVARFGKGRVWEEAAQLAVPRAFGEIVQSQKLETIGSPSIDVIKLAPDNPFIFKATVALLPEITLGDYNTIKLEKKPTDIAPEHIDKVLTDLQKMQTKETAVDRPATAADKVVIDMAMSLDTVPLDGGTTKDHAIYLHEDYYIPGMKDQLHGVKKGDTKEFQLKFPKEHYQKMIAGKDVDFKITVKEVFGLDRPGIDDVFAKSLGQPDVEAMRQLIQKNLEGEAMQKESERIELALLEEVISKTKFSDIPDILVNEETHKMIGELEDSITRQGMVFADYLKKISKTRDELRLNFAADALKRVKTALAIRKISQVQSVTISEEEIDQETNRILELYKDQPETHEQIRSPGAREYVRGMLQNRKVIEWLKEQTKIV